MNSTAEPGVMQGGPRRPRTGRRPGPSGTRVAILQAARRLFAERGYAGATIRAIAQEAQVDAALVHHFYSSKEGLFAAAIEDWLTPGDLIPDVAEGGIDGLGERLVRAFLGLWDDDQARDSLLAIICSAVSHGEAARLLRELISSEILDRVIQTISKPDAELRATLIGTELVGLIMSRFVIRAEPLASASPETVVRFLAPTIQNYLESDF